MLSLAVHANQLYCQPSGFLSEKREEDKRRARFVFWKMRKMWLNKKLLSYRHHILTTCAACHLEHRTVRRTLGCRLSKIAPKTSTEVLQTSFWAWWVNRPFAQLLAWVRDGASGDGRSVTCTWLAPRTARNGDKKSTSRPSETLKQHVGDWPTVTGCPVSNPGNNCANGVFRIMCSSELELLTIFGVGSTLSTSRRQS